MRGLYLACVSISIVVLTTIILVVLKLTNYIAWSWLWVLAPFWIMTAIGVLCAFLIVAHIVMVIEVQSRITK